MFRESQGVTMTTQSTIHSNYIVQYYNNILDQFWDHSRAKSDDIIDKWITSFAVCITAGLICF